MKAAVLPQETRPIRMDPDLEAAVAELLEPYSGKELDRAQAAVVSVHHSSVTGVFGALVKRYDAAISEAVSPGGG